MLVSSIDSLITPLTMRIRASTQYMHERTSPCAFVLRFGKFFRKRPLPDLDRELQILARTLFTILVLAPYKELFVTSPSPVVTAIQPAECFVDLLSDCDLEFEVKPGICI